jgi:hypothetical protein
VTRNDRDGSLISENGRGAVVKNLTAQNSQALSTAAPWLDTVQIELAPTPERVAIIEARVFDHATRTLVSDIAPAFGWRVAAPDVLQIYGLGKPLPEKLDIWFRLHSYAAADEVQTLAAQPAASCEFSDGTKIAIRELRPGMSGGWSSLNGFRTIASSDEGQIVADLSVLQPKSSQQLLQIAAVLRSGEKVFSEHEHYFVPSVQSPDPRRLVTWDADLSDLASFEVRPFGGRERFFFEAVELPKASNRPFAAPPTTRVTVGGAEIDERIPDFEPLEVRIATHRGRSMSGTRSSLRRVTFVRSSQPTDLNRAFTLIASTYGVSVKPNAKHILKAFPTAHGIFSSNTTASNGNQSITGAEYRIPLDQVDAIDVSFAP